MEHEAARPLILPLGIVSTTHVAQLYRELEMVDEFLEQSRMRQGGTNVVLPRISRMLEEITTVNGLNLLQPADRKRLTGFLVQLKDNAPILHFSFAAEPSASFMRKLTKWLRTEIHPMALVQTGLQPKIAVGCMLRTNNKYFDLSLRKQLAKSRDNLVQLMRGDA